MTYRDFLPLLWPLLFLAIFFLGKRRNNLTLFKQVYWQLILLFFLNSTLSLLKLPLLHRLQSPNFVYILWLLVLLVLLVFLVRVLGFLIFDVLVQAKQGMRYPRLFKDIVVFVLYVIGVLLIFNYYLHVKKISIFLASSAVLTVIIGLAVQDILGNLFSGIVLNFDDSFKLGNWIHAGQYEGRIEQLGWRSIKVRTVDNHLIVIPNQSASKQDILVSGDDPGQPFALRLRIGVSYRTPPDRVIEAIQRAVRSVPQVLDAPPSQALVVDFSESAITYEIRYWTTDPSARNAINSEIRRKLWYEFSRSQIQIPFPIRDIYLKREPPPEVGREEVVAALRENDVLRVIDEAAFSRLMEGVDHGHYGCGDLVIDEGEPSYFFYHILKGEVEVRKGGKPLTTLGPGQFFGEISLVTGELPNATVMIRREAVLIRVSSAKFREAVGMNQDLALRLSDLIARRQAETRQFALQTQEIDPDRAIKKNSANLFLRIIAYFGIKK